GCSPTAAGGGNWNDLDHTTGAHFKGEFITVIHCGNLPENLLSGPTPPPGSTSPKTDFNYILFTGTGEMFPPGNKKRVAITFYGFYEDRNEPGSHTADATKDRYFVQVNDTNTGALVDLIDKNGTPFNFATLLASGNFDDISRKLDADAVLITHGNLQLHQSGCDKFAASPLSQPLPTEATIDEAFPTELSFGAPPPNPTGTAMAIRYGLPSEATVGAKVFDVAGRVVRDFGEYALAAGWHQLSWDLNGESGQRVGPGLYFLRLSVNGQALTRTVTVLR